jgi:hypothetical protein
MTMTTTNWTAENVRLERWTRGPLTVLETPAARHNKALMERHFLAEWTGDIEATMSTMHPVQPFQRIPALGVEVVGQEPVRQYYLNRFAHWPGPVMGHFDRVTVTDTCLYTEGVLALAPEAQVAGGVRLVGPCVVVIDFRDGLIVGETVYAQTAGDLSVARPPTPPAR